MKKSFGTMMSGKDALKLLDKICSEIDIKKHEKEFGETLVQMKNRLAYHVDQASPVKLKYHKGK